VSLSSGSFLIIIDHFFVFYGLPRSSFLFCSLLLFSLLCTSAGALHGLTRVRRFQQDDAHIFCTPEQIEQEITGALDFLRHIYTLFGFEFTLNLSTRPEKYLGEIATWDLAEKV
jgi:hypothetical protein